jgi:hypothetical protein
MKFSRGRLLRWSRGALIAETFMDRNPRSVTERHQTRIVSAAFSKALDTATDLTGTFNRVLQDRNGPETFARCPRKTSTVPLLNGRRKFSRHRS